MSIDDPNLEGMDWLKAELEDALDEDYELEMSEPALSIRSAARSVQGTGRDSLDRSAGLDESLVPVQPEGRYRTLEGAP